MQTIHTLRQEVLAAERAVAELDAALAGLTPGQQAAFNVFTMTLSSLVVKHGEFFQMAILYNSAKWAHQNAREELADAMMKGGPETETRVCKGTNCTSTDGHGHSPECEAEHAAAIAGGSFVPSAQSPAS